MLRIVQSKSAAAAKKYFAESLSRPDYHAEGGHSPGWWLGQGAARLGLEGKVSQDDFFALADNRHPETGQRLTVRDVANRRPGYDLVFSPKKSVSALWARTGDDRIVAAFRAAVEDTLREDIEPEIMTRLRRAGQDGDVVTGNLAASLFLHQTTRPLADGGADPHLHIHAYMQNLTWAEHENRWQAVQFGRLKEDARYFEAAFDARLARNLQKLGYEIERHAKGWEVAGVPGTVLEKYSRRTAEIEAEAKRRGITDPDKKAELGAATRRAKAESLATDQLRQYWNDRLTAAERRTLDAVVRAAASGSSGGGTPRVTTAQAMEHAVGHVFARDSAVADKQLLAEALRYGVGSVMPRDVKTELAGHGIITASIAGRQVVTTRDVLAEEQAMLAFARQGRGRLGALGGRSPVVFKRDFLSGDQKNAVRGLLASKDRVTLLIGKAGTGKTTMLAELRDQLNDRGRELLAFAPSAQASRGVLRAKGFPTADTVANLLRDEALQERVRGAVILIDEAGLAGTQALRAVFALAEEKDARVVLSGDPKQHRGVPRGTVLRTLQEQAGLGPVRLTDIRRQSGAYKKAIEALSEGRAAEGFDQLDGLGFIREIEDAGERNQLLARDYADTLASGQTVLIVAPTHAEGRAVTQAVREELRERGVLGEERTVVCYEGKDLTEQQKKDAVQYEPGDTVLFQKHAPGFKAGERVRVTGRRDGQVLVENAAGQSRTLPLPLADRFEPYRTTELAVAPGEVLRVTRNGYTADKKRVHNGDLVRVAGFAADGGLELADGRRLAKSYRTKPRTLARSVSEEGCKLFPRLRFGLVGRRSDGVLSGSSKDFGHLAPGAVLTSHASQGKSVEVVLVAQSGTSLPASGAEQFYVSSSRGEKALRLYTDDKEALRQAVARQERARSASEVWQARQAEQQERTRHWQRMRRVRQRYQGILSAWAGREHGNRRPPPPDHHHKKEYHRERA